MGPVSRIGDASTSWVPVVKSILGSGIRPSIPLGPLILPDRGSSDPLRDGVDAGHSGVGWNRGIRSVGSSDLSVNCNCILGNVVGVQHKRYKPTIDAANGVNRFFRNNFVENDSLNVNSLTGPYDGAHGLKFGSVNDALAGENRLELSPDPGAINYRLWGNEIAGRSDSAQVNRWLDASGIEIEEADINNYNKIRTNQDLWVDSPAPSDPTCSSSCSAVGPEAETGRLAVMQRDAGPGAFGDPGGASLPKAHPADLALHGPRPNPSHGRVPVALDVPAERAAEVVHLDIYDVTGRHVASLIQGQPGAGWHRFVWDLTSSDGSRVSPGVFFVRAEIGDYRKTRKITVLR